MGRSLGPKLHEWHWLNWVDCQNIAFYRSNLTRLVLINSVGTRPFEFVSFCHQQCWFRFWHRCYIVPWRVLENLWLVPIEQKAKRRKYRLWNPLPLALKYVQVNTRHCTHPLISYFHHHIVLPRLVQKCYYHMERLELELWLMLALRGGKQLWVRWLE